MKKKSYTKVLSSVLAIVLIGLITPANAQPYYDAYFTSIKVTHGNGTSELIYGGTAKVYVGQKTWINLTYYNERCGVFWASLYTKVYENDVLVATSTEANVLRGTSYENQFYLYKYQPDTVNYKVELWWDSSGTHYLEDVNYFNIQFVKLFVDNWSPSPLTVEKGKTTPSTWPVSFRNGGNDVMYNTSISIIDSGGLQFSTMSANLGDIASEGTKSTSFSVIAPSTLSTGSKTVSFEITYNDFRGTPHVESETADVIVVELGSSLTLTLTPSSVKKDGSISITAKLIDGNGNPLINQPISFYIGTTSLGSVNTDSSGNAIKSYAASADAGTYVITASYAGSIDYGPASATSNLVVNKLDTVLTVDAPSVKVGATVTITAILKDEDGNPISDANVDFYLFENNLWSKIESSATNPVGQASITQIFNTAGDFQIKTVYAGNINYNEVNATASLKVIQLATTLTIEVPSAIQGKECTLKATLVDENGLPLQNMNIDFYIYEMNAWKKIGSASTDSGGVACLDYTPSSTGTFQVKTMFSGTATYAQNSCTPASLDVIIDYTPYYIVGGIIAVALIGTTGYLVFRRRKKPNIQS